ncbi:MAG: tetratricopeptide repeat protein [Oscillatoria sp. SIO1A7]|nr:tetratricopeptide repeat protein [Oscillatoria sp. SIO1A7]
MSPKSSYPSSPYTLHPSYGAPQRILLIPFVFLSFFSLHPTPYTLHPSHSPIPHSPMPLNNLLSTIWLALERGEASNSLPALRQASELLSLQRSEQIDRNLALQILARLVDMRPFYSDYLRFFEACYSAQLLGDRSPLGSKPVDKNGIPQSDDPPQGIAFARRGKEADGVFKEGLGGSSGTAFDHASPLVAELKHKFATIYAQSCVSYWHSDRLERAELMAKQALALEPNSAAWNLNLGKILGEQGQLDEAVKLVRRALEIDEKFTEARHALANLYTKIGDIYWQRFDYPQVETIARQALELNPDSAALNHNLGKVLYYQGLFNKNTRKFQEAELYLRQALEIKPNLEKVRDIIIGIPYAKHFAWKGYSISTDCFTGNISIWQKYLQPLAHSPGINVLEIGCFEGMASCWLLDNILTHDSARITCIDNFEGVWEKTKNDPNANRTVEQRFDFNIAISGSANKVTKLVGLSQEVMRSLPLNSYDLIYIDGSHKASDVLEDAVISWRLLKAGGWIIFDDYNFVFRDNPNWNTGLGIDAFMSVMQEQITVIYRGDRQVFIKKEF